MRVPWSRSEPTRRELTPAERRRDAAFDNFVAGVETGQLNLDGSRRCLDCELGEPHACQIATEQLQAAYRQRAEAERVITEIEGRR